LAGVAALCACASFSGAAWFVVALFEWDDHRPGSGVSYATFVLIVSLILAIGASLKLGWRTGQDWYRKGVN
jgi:hypothetical protein